MNVLLLADQNQRAAIAVLRALKESIAAVYVAQQDGTSRRRIFTSYAQEGRVNQRPLVYAHQTPSDFQSSLLRIKEEIGGPYILFPLGEKLLRWAIQDRAFLESRDIQIPTVGFETYVQVSDKSSFVDLAQEYGLDVPVEFDSIPQKFETKFVVKPRDGSGNRQGILERPMLVESDAVLKNLQRLEIDESQHFIQEYLEGASYYYCGLYDRGKKCLGFGQKTLVQQPNGLSVVQAAPATLPEELIEKIDKMFGSLKWHGVMMFEVKERTKDCFCAIECNPRFWGPLQLALDNGVDFPTGLMRLIKNESVVESVTRQKPVGYLWRAGFVHGYILKGTTGASFQNFREPTDSKLSYRDVWFRGGTFYYALMEVGILLAPYIHPKALWRTLRRRLGRKEGGGS